MNLDKQLIDRLIRVLFPAPRKSLAGALSLTGLAMVGGAHWEPIINTFLERYLGVTSMPSPDPMVGWILLALGGTAIIINEILDRRIKPSKVSAEERADAGVLQALFSELHLPSLDRFIEKGKVSIVYVPTLHYFFGLEAIVQSSTFYIHDQQLSKGVENLHASLSKALSFGEYFRDMSNDKLQKFDNRRDVHSDPHARAAHDSFLQAVWDTETNLRELCRAVKSKYPEFDFNVTNRQALDNYNHHNEKAAKELSIREFSVLAKIIKFEEDRSNFANLVNLSEALKMPKVDVQVVLDKLIKLKYAKHLYPGQLHQRYTVLQEGRAYYVRSRDSIKES